MNNMFCYPIYLYLKEKKKYIDDLKKSSTYVEALEVFPDLEISSVNNLEDND